MTAGDVVLVSLEPTLTGLRPGLALPSFRLCLQSGIKTCAWEGGSTPSPCLVPVPSRAPGPGGEGKLGTRGGLRAAAWPLRGSDTGGSPASVTQAGRVGTGEAGSSRRDGQGTPQREACGEGTCSRLRAVVQSQPLPSRQEELFLRAGWRRPEGTGRDEAAG